MAWRWPTLATLGLIAAPPLAAQSAADARWLAECREGHDYWQVERHWQLEHCEVRVSVLAPGGTLTIDPGTNGGVAVEGWDGDSVEVHARIQTHAPSDTEAVAIARDIQVITAGRSIGVRGPTTGRRANWGVSFVVYTPRHSDLRVGTYNGPIAVRELHGRIELTAHNGPVELDGVGGDVRVRATNGPLEITLVGARWDGQGLDAETTNGPVSLAIPEGYSAELEFGTVNGPMTLDFPLTVTIQGRVGRHITTKLGAGGATVRAVTTNGPVEIRRN